MGGQWRVVPDDLKTFMGMDSFAETANRPKPNPENRTYGASGKRKGLVSAAVDVNVAFKEEALRLSSTILAAMNSRVREEAARCDYLFYE